MTRRRQAEDERTQIALNIRNDEAERISRELARLTGETVTTAIAVAVRERLERVHRDTPPREERIAHLLELGRQIGQSLGPDPMLPEDLYDDQTGLPV